MKSYNCIYYVFVLATSWYVSGVECNFSSRIAITPRHDQLRFMNPTSSQGKKKSKSLSWSRKSFSSSSASSSESSSSSENSVTLASRIKKIRSSLPQRIDVGQRGGSSAVAGAVKTMTARKMETFR